MCDYCERKSDLLPTLQDEMAVSIKERSWDFIIDIFHRTPYYQYCDAVKINYCPMCGRKLDGES